MKTQLRILFAKSKILKLIYNLLFIGEAFISLVIEVALVVHRHRLDPPPTKRSIVANYFSTRRKTQLQSESAGRADGNTVNKLNQLHAASRVGRGPRCLLAIAAARSSISI